VRIHLEKLACLTYVPYALDCASVRAHIPFVLLLVEVRIAGTIICNVAAVSGIAKVTDAVPTQRIVWVRSAITAQCRAGSPETRASTTSWPNRGLVEPETPAKPASTKTETPTIEATLAESV
jgi:hypothetical protein